MLESDGLPTSARPPLTLFFSVMSIDAWERHRHLGYAYFSPPVESGVCVREISSWKLAETRENALHNFFIGGAWPPRAK